MTTEHPDAVSILNGFSAPAILLNRDYRILAANDRYRQLYGFSDQPRQHRCHEVSHGYNVPCDLAGETCPLRESLRSGEQTQVLHIHHTPRGHEYVNVEMWPLRSPETGEVSWFIELMHPSDAASARSRNDGRLVGSAPAFQAMLDLVNRVARSNSSVMLLGESGTGKEMVAQTLHRLSGRADAPFVPVECTGLPDALFESELFGYVRGAFTGASHNRAGLVAAAEGGTLFLDEVGDIPLAEQVKLLRLLETRRYRPVGSSEWREADFRLVCATNRDLEAMVEAGSFREDLFYRLNVFEIQLPPLRERLDDLPVLIETILGQLGASRIRFSADALACLRAYRFPGNVRELRNIVERSILLADDGVVHSRHLPERCRGGGHPAAEAETGIVPLHVAEHRYLQAVLRRFTGSRRELADLLGVSERVLYRKLAATRE
ncbi:MAG: sigma 54-interacting transcriptional regulator [Pseudomonadales bacterium]|nr:sigma 54-interacting transcriptional regulator [Pseudomonadales bacterium]MCP5185050.1 sigma 54-interacting transcriptional regulator [Pseudomonadales bacterium]